ncbi:DUF2789 family protein [Neptuniibacter caesariensis]|uniref:DUF2789 domain-containing protein n=1 Tax=Neptuniibacter caesariensis TaxID=207954 RepID=A0A7U8GT85_NEPCE|nr:DUF2789 family protein [Neptuniibacter caesariensis]EAR61885.1 hypothetical protein MED92_03018 [Oceanospirillum sp. MED92] [Neptuniibacter caesariensis]
MLYYDTEMQQLFKQLGLNDDPDSIDDFIEQNKIYTHELHIADAPCWSKSQSDFLRESIYYDSKWSDSIDELDIILRN